MKQSPLVYSCVFWVYFSVFFAFIVVPIIRQSQGFPLDSRPKSTWRWFASQKFIQSEIFWLQLKVYVLCTFAKVLLSKIPSPAFCCKWAFSAWFHDSFFLWVLVILKVGEAWVPRSNLSLQRVVQTRKFSLHRGQTSCSVFHFISREFIHTEVETLAGIYRIAVECKCILISPT